MMFNEDIEIPNDIEDKLNTCRFIISEGKIWENEDDGVLKYDGWWHECVYDVLEVFRIFPENYLIKILLALEHNDWRIDLEENTDSFGEHIEYYYSSDGDDDMLSHIADYDTDLNNDLLQKETDILINVYKNWKKINQ